MQELAKKGFHIEWGKGSQRFATKACLELFEINGEVYGIVHLSSIKKGVRIKAEC